ncbi:M15 family metallopeptidase [Clostridium polynesiense]|uniref:M15 family metallopeptidase n=1 Tax=Clostridium polynesiense TaxID=1325933 RepID=UPI0006944DB5|nr:M15 family metallopeptidase [Clostridium polynesiense]
MKKYIAFISATIIVLGVMLYSTKNEYIFKIFGTSSVEENSEKQEKDSKDSNKEGGVLKNISGIFNKYVKDDSEDKGESPSAEIEEENDNNSEDKYKYSQGILLVNRKNKLDKDFIPKELVVPKVKFKSSADPLVKKMEKEAAEALERMFNAAREEGITLLGVSGYRSYKIQESVYNNKVKKSGKSYADKYVAQPGTSEHQSGLSMDMVSTEHTALDTAFENTKAFKWLDANAHKYGFILRYPKGKEKVTGYNYEPWHYRYVGVNASEEIKNYGITLEEYMEN